MLYSAGYERSDAVAGNYVDYVFYVFARAHIVFAVRQVYANPAELAYTYFKRGTRSEGGVSEQKRNGNALENTGVFVRGEFGFYRFGCV